MTLEKAQCSFSFLYEDGFTKEDILLLLHKIYEDFDKDKSCEGCIHHKAYNGNFPLSCCECSRFYPDNFEEMKK